MKRKRPEDEDYYIAPRTHVSQGDVFRGVEFRHPADPDISVTLHGLLLNYTSSMLVGNEGTNAEYRHDFRVIAPIFSLEIIPQEDDRWTYPKIQQLRSADHFGGWMYLPVLPGEYGESAAALFRPVLLLQEQLEGKRAAAMSWNALRHLEVKLAKVYAGVTPDLPEDHPDMRDHWHPSSAG